MSEYQYYEFQAIDRPLTDREMRERDLQRWVSKLPEAEKTELLVRVASGDEPHLRAELLRRQREQRKKPTDATTKPRTAAELQSAAEHRTEERRQKEADRAAREKARRDREEAATREKYLKGLAKREPETWQQIGELIRTKRPADYDEAVKLLVDLRDLAVRSSRVAEA